MKALALSLLLALTPATMLAETPQSIVGTWRLDLARSLSEHLDRLAESLPDPADRVKLVQMKDSMVRNAEATDDAIVTFTENTMISKTVNVRYTVIGGNAGLVVIQYTDDEGHEFINNIWLVDGGIAYESTDCETYPDQCARERQRSMAAISQVNDNKPEKQAIRVAVRPKIDANNSRGQGSIRTSTRLMTLGGRARSPATGRNPSAIRRMYFTRVAPE